jgi:hypothetical protein
MEIVTEWPTEEFSQLLMGVLAADFLGSLALEALAGMIFPLPKGVLWVGAVMRCDLAVWAMHSHIGIDRRSPLESVTSAVSTAQS